MAGGTSCLGCRVRRNRVPETLAGVYTVVDKEHRIASRTVTHSDGRTRYHGRGRRGQQTHAELNAQDLDMADESYRAFRAGVKLLGSAEAKTWTRAELESVRNATAHQGQRTSDSIDPILERIGHFKQRHGRRDGE